MKAPDFLCIGAAKAGTTTLHDILIQHPDIYLPPFKEAHFFDNDAYYIQGTAWYEKNVFRLVKNEKIIGEITPSYFYFENAPERIYKTLGPDAKLILMLRNPVDRAFSHYSMHYERGNEKLGFEEAIAAEQERISRNYGDKIMYSYISRGFYFKQLQAYLDYFPLSQIHVIFFEEFLQDKETTISKVFDFLGVSRFQVNLDIKSNESGAAKSRLLNKLMYRSSITRFLGKFLIPSHQLRKSLKQFLKRRNIKKKEGGNKLPNTLRIKLMEKYFLDDIHQLEKLLDKDLSNWYK